MMRRPELLDDKHELIIVPSGEIDQSLFHGRDHGFDRRQYDRRESGEVMGVASMTSIDRRLAQSEAQDNALVGWFLFSDGVRN